MYELWNLKKKYCSKQLFEDSVWIFKNTIFIVFYSCLYNITHKKNILNEKNLKNYWFNGNTLFIFIIWYWQFRGSFNIHTYMCLYHLNLYCQSSSSGSTTTRGSLASKNHWRSWDFIGFPTNELQIMRMI